MEILDITFGEKAFDKHHSTKLKFRELTSFPIQISVIIFTRTIVISFLPAWNAQSDLILIYYNYLM